MTSVDSAIKEAIAPIVAAANLYLEGIQISSAGKHRVIRVLVDHIDTQLPLSLDEVTAVTKPISATLDELAILGERPFTLEVSSPGVDFPLKLPRHWKRNQGRLVALLLKSGEQVMGRIIGSDDVTASIEITPGTTVEVLLSDIAQANIEVEFK